SDSAVLLSTLGKLWLAGVTIAWAGFYTHERRRRVPLPTYAFERQRYWIEAKKSAHALASAAIGINEELERTPDITDWFFVPAWKQALPSDLFSADTLIG